MSGGDLSRWRRLLAVRQAQRDAATAALARSLTEADALAAQAVQIVALARDTLGTPGAMGAAELSGRMRFGQRMQGAAAAIDAAHGRATIRVDRMRSDAVARDRAADQASRLHDAAERSWGQAIERRALAELAVTRRRAGPGERS